MSIIASILGLVGLILILAVELILFREGPGVIMA
jgi:hypothetical protein